MLYTIGDPDVCKLEKLGGWVEVLFVLMGTLDGLLMGGIILLTCAEVSLGFKGVMKVLDAM
eukprot:7106176-Ditylum_brightwellii.AAC.1